MRGIGGFLWIGKGLGPFDSERSLWRMIGTLRHRGPDDQGVWHDGVCGLV
jgi:asparagine synthetase B (glutamine-hydrolysing)